MSLHLPVIRFMNIRPVRTPEQIQRASRITDCTERLRVALRETAADQEHLYNPYPSFRRWLAGEGFETVIHPAYRELLTLESEGDARRRFTQVADEVLREREFATRCDSCEKPVALIVCEIDANAVVLCPRCAAVELDERLNRRHGAERLVAA